PLWEREGVRGEKTCDYFSTITRRYIRTRETAGLGLPRTRGVLDSRHGRFSTDRIRAGVAAWLSGSGVFVRHAGHVGAAREKRQTHADERHSLRMRDGAGRPGQHAALGEV